MDKGDYYALAVALLLACSIATRGGYMAVGRWLPLPEGVRRGLRYAPVAALTAMIVPDLLPWRADAGPVLDIKLLAGAVGALAYWRTRNTVWVIVAGMAVFWLARWAAA